MNRPIAIALLLSIVCGYLFFFHLGSLALTDPDETFYAQTAKEMTAGGEWLTPHLYGKPQFEKPALFYWLVEASYKFFGVNEFAARFPSAVAGLIGVIAVFFLGSLLFGSRVGILSAIILATNVEYIMLSRACITDMLLGTLTILGMLFFFYGYIREKTVFYSFSAAAFALATLTKGPVGILLPGIILALYLLMTGELVTVIKKARIYWPAIIFIAIAAPWYIVMYKTHGQAFIDEFFGFRNINRFLVPEHKIGSQFYFYVPVVFGALFPWSAFLPFALWQSARNAFKGSGAGRRYPIFLLLWFLVIFIFFSISGTKLVTYIFPMFGALSIMIALVWEDLFMERPAAGTEKWMKISYYLLFTVIMAGVIVLYFIIRKRYPLILGGAITAGALLVFGFILSAVSFARKNYTSTFFFIIYALLIFTYPLIEIVIPGIERYETSREIAMHLNGMMKENDAVASESHYRAGVAFYTGHFPKDIDRHEDLVRFLDTDERVWIVMKDKNHRQLYELDTKPFCTRPSYMVYKLGKKCIVTNKLPDTGKYIVKRERTE